jgi:N-acyl-D-amino-acid deacylase
VGRYSREGLVTLEEAVSHVTSAPARRFGLQERGLLRPGCIADLVVFDAQSFTDRASTGASKALAEGVSDVLISGVPVIRDGVRTDQTPARALRRQAVGRS